MPRAQRVWKALKTHPFRALLVVAFALGLLLTLTVSLPSTSSTMPSFQFLAGHRPTPMVHNPDRPLGRWSLDFYSFAGDFESVCAAAQTELSTLGYTQAPAHPGDFYKTREYQLRGNAPDGMITVRILAGAKLRVFSTPKNSQYPSPDRYGYRPEADWVTVEVVQYRRTGPWEMVKARVSGLLRRVGL